LSLFFQATKTSCSLVGLPEQAIAAYTVSLACNFDGAHQAFLNVAVDRSLMRINKPGRTRDLEQLDVFLAGRTPKLLTGNLRLDHFSSLSVEPDRAGIG
jgi:hypothetical protein